MEWKEYDGVENISKSLSQCYDYCEMIYICDETATVTLETTQGCKTVCDLSFSTDNSDIEIDYCLTNCSKEENCDDFYQCIGECGSIDGYADGDEEEESDTGTLTFCNSCYEGTNTLYSGYGAVFTPEAIDDSGNDGGDGAWRTGDYLAFETVTNFGFEDGELYLGYGNLSRLARISWDSTWRNPSAIYLNGPYDTTTGLAVSKGDIIIMILEDRDSGDQFAFGFEVIESSYSELKMHWVFNTTANDLTLLAD